MSVYRTITRFICELCGGSLFRIHPGNEFIEPRFCHDRQASNHHKPQPLEIQVRRWC